MSIKKYQAGLSLVELMIAMVLGLILSGVAIQIFASNKTTYRLENELSRLQENGRFVVESMVKDIRMAGYNGCSSRREDISVTTIANDPPPFTIDGTSRIRGFNDNGTGWLPAIAADLNLTGVLAGTDILNIQKADSCGAHVTGNFLPTNANLQVTFPNTCDFDANQVVMVTDCIAADVYQVTNHIEASSTETLAHSNASNASNNLSKAYGPDAQVFRWTSEAYFVGTGASGEPALFRSSWTPDGVAAITAADFTVMELADGVEDMQILYGEDTAGDQYADTYVTANAVLNWEDVRSARINLLLRSRNPITSEPRSIIFNGATVNGGIGADRRLRMAYSSTVTIRNSLP